MPMDVGKGPIFKKNGPISCLAIIVQSYSPVSVVKRYELLFLN